MKGRRAGTAPLQFGHACYRGIVVGVDEAGRGPLAGPVLAAAVILCPDRPVDGLDDSKRLTASQRESLAEAIRANAVSYALGRASEREIDRLNILQASLLAMGRAVEALKIAPDHALIDGKICPALRCHTHAVVKGDATFQEIAAASILAKVARDREMMSLHEQFPVYGFAQHKGYPTQEHLRRLKAHGVSPVHRRSFGPVRALLVTVDDENPGRGAVRDEHSQSGLFE